MRTPNHSQYHHSTAFSILLLGALAVGAAGYWGPWVNHRAVALILIGQDLGEFVKFLPEVRSGAMVMVRQFFYLPPFCTCCLLALIASSGWDRHCTLRYPRAIRALCLLAIAPVSLALLPPVVSIPVLKSEEFRLQVIGTLFCLTLIPGAWLTRRLPPPARMAWVGIFGLLGAVPALWQFGVVMPAIQSVYRTPIELGWGVFATGLGFGAVGILGLAQAVRLTRRLPDYSLVL